MKAIILPLLLLFGTALSLGAQETATTPSVDEIASAYIEAIGGADAWKALSATQTEGKVSMQGMEFPFTMIAAEGGKSRLDLDIQGSKMVQAYDGETAWTYFPMQGITEPKELTGDDATDLKQNPFLDVFIDSEARGYSLAAVEGREVEGASTYGVRVTNENGFDRTYYFDTEYMVPILMTSTIKGGPMQGVVSETYLSDYQELEGLTMPMFIDQKMNGQTMMKMTMEEVNLHPEVDPAIFGMDSLKE